MNGPVGQCGSQALDEAAGQGEPGVVGSLVHQGETHRQRERAVEEGQRDDDRGDDPVVAVADLVRAGGRPVVEPGRGVHLRSAAVKQCVVDRDRHRLPVGHEQAPPAAGQAPQ